MLWPCFVLIQLISTQLIGIIYLINWFISIEKGKES